MAKNMILIILVISGIFISLALIFLHSLNVGSIILGIILGSAVSIIKVILLKRSINKVFNEKQDQAKAYTGLQYLLRFALTAGILVVGALVPQINLLGVIAGVLSFQLATYIVQLMMRKQGETESLDIKNSDQFEQIIKKQKKKEDEFDASEILENKDDAEEKSKYLK
ncbi:MAG: ATP synthase subunit I [Clostridiaceae bacterium]|nr:ATP synthase subunit I [Clostridiaceae bacterium]